MSAARSIAAIQPLDGVKITVVVLVFQCAVRLSLSAGSGWLRATDKNRCPIHAWQAWISHALLSCVLGTYLSLIREEPMSHLMDIDRQAGEIMNHTELGRQIQAFADQSMDAIVADHPWFEGTWQCGGCLMFARALQEWAGGSLSLAVIRSGRNPEIVQHVVCQIGEDVYADGDGIGTGEEMVRKAAEMEHVAAPYLEGADEDTEMGADIADHPGLRARLVELMTERMGVFDRGMVEDLGREIAAPVMR
jgi:hypothetical protein